MSITVLFPHSDESWPDFVQRAKQTEGDILLILAERDHELIRDPHLCEKFLSVCAKLSDRLRIASKRPKIISVARSKGIRVLSKSKHLHDVLDNQEVLHEALQFFSPTAWQKQLKSQLQRMGFLSLPRLRIFALMGVSVLLLFFVVFRLLPSAEIEVVPRTDSISQTANIFLVLSGATLDTKTNVKTMPLIPLTVMASRSMTFDQITRRFSGTNARMPMTIINQSDEVYSFLKGTRFMNQAGVIFRILDPVDIDPGAELEVRSQADEIDFYGQPVGERGNVPEGLTWEIPGLSEKEKKIVYGVNRIASKGGSTSFRTVLEQEDIDTAVSHLKKELIQLARQLIHEERTLKNTQEENIVLDILDYPELTNYSFTGFVLPTQFIGEPIVSIPVEGTIIYKQFAYDSDAILQLLKDQLISHVREGKILLGNLLQTDRLVVHVIDYAEDLRWIKLTVDLTGSEQYILGALSPSGARFGAKVREAVLGLNKEEARRIVQNMQEVDHVKVNLWPPWNATLPTIPAHISIVTD